MKIIKIHLKTELPVFGLLWFKQTLKIQNDSFVGEEYM